MTEPFLRRAWNTDVDTAELEGMRLDEAYTAGFWACHNQMLNEIFRYGAEVERRGWPNMAKAVRALMKYLTTKETAGDSVHASVRRRS